jgi:hypothetical protein
VLLPLALLAALAAAGIVAVLRSDTSTIILYNQTGEALGPLRLQACGQTVTLRHLDDQESFRWSLEPRGSESELTLEAATIPPLQWRGGYVEPRGGYYVILRLWPDGQVEEHTQINAWQRFLKGRPEPAE